ncbi:MAG: preprotein translocase subunit SecE [Actinomycetia bacterium]|nr:preprotein translocase subunit SecE [Actinomycetes bacterium]
MADKFPSLPDEGDQRPGEELDAQDESSSGVEPDFDSLVEDAGDEAAVTDVPEADAKLAEAAKVADDKLAEAVAATNRPLTPVQADDLDEAELALTPEGEDLVSPDLPDVAAQVAADETEAEELSGGAVFSPEPEEPAIDEEQLDEASRAARKAASTRPVRRQPKAVPAEETAAAESDETDEDTAAPRPVRRTLTQAPVKKDRPTTKQSEAAKTAPKPRGPIVFAKQSIAELKKVVWPSGEQTGQYFLVVLVFVLFLMVVVTGLDYGFGWSLTKWLGGS